MRMTPRDCSVAVAVDAASRAALVSGLAARATQIGAAASALAVPGAAFTGKTAVHPIGATALAVRADLPCLALPAGVAAVVGIGMRVEADAAAVIQPGATAQSRIADLAGVTVGVGAAVVHRNTFAEQAPVAPSGAGGTDALPIDATDLAIAT